MKNRKKLLAFLLALALTAGLAACGDSGRTAQESGNASDASESQPESEPESAESGTAEPESAESETAEPESGTPEPAESAAEPESQESQGGEDAFPEGTIGGAGDSLSADIQKETAYTSGFTLVTGYGDEDESIYDLEYVDGVLSAAYYEDNEGKGGWGSDSGISIEDCKFYGMTVEEASEALESMNYRVEIH